ncbi:hypothetical protein DIPPA_51628 [Diplonema papillatum]|nr:hypothetical protein DIPPA_51628 [Diplonema papillatum]
MGGTHALSGSLVHGAPPVLLCSYECNILLFVFGLLVCAGGCTHKSPMTKGATLLAAGDGHEPFPQGKALSGAVSLPWIQEERPVIDQPISLLTAAFTVIHWSQVDRVIGSHKQVLRSVAGQYCSVSTDSSVTGLQGFFLLLSRAALHLFPPSFFLIYGSTKTTSIHVCFSAATRVQFLRVESSVGLDEYPSHWYL